MNYLRSRTLVTAMLLAGGAAFATDAQEPAPQANCKAVQASMVEDGSTTNCKPGHPSCFLGEVDGNQGLRGTTYFRADNAAAGPSTSPGFISYIGVFEYTPTGEFSRCVKRASSIRRRGTPRAER